MSASDMAWLRIHREGDIQRIGPFLKGHRVNTYSPKFDRNGKPYLTLGWDDRPDSDWGRYRGSTAAVWCADVELAIRAEAAIRKALRFEPSSSSFSVEGAA